MNEEEIKNIHVVQSRNVRHLKRVQKSMTMDINHYLIKNDTFQVGIKTKLYSLLYSALSESQFTQIIHTPFGFVHSEILKIQSERSLVDSWHLLLDLALKKVGNWETNSDLALKRNKLKELITEYIEKPQELRNKLAHGQWLFALNSKNTKENETTTERIEKLNVVEISIWFEVHQYLCFIIRDLVQSPSKKFHFNYWINLTELEKFLEKSSAWTLEKRVESLKIKYDNRKITVPNTV
ncbi:hypothetical protein F7642_12590 [Tenacibaculum finnmarkense genomovar ulcerans]|uniref:hypothetical protein n=1 Tax=Tenacibaculum finnmarkense TaxID=2781243 RepID=UPI00187BA782|nr:hypothetical protein [Tenacibaculum finnmarkense]MBE7635161.1 hypothetical protein [Tenacibaculum finnmarkense genomovar ulcerans]MCD8431101.1 hypothetical protein [Tenacibaculum finnmarkense genomovar ulcerans]